MSVSGQDGGKRISPLRQRMIADMDLAGLASGTQKEYVRAVRDLVRYHNGKRPELMTEEEVYRYVLWLRDEKQVARGTFYGRFYGVKFLFYRTLGLDWALFSKRGCGLRGRSVYRGRCPEKSAAA